LRIKYSYFVVISRPVVHIINLAFFVSVIKQINDVAFCLELPPSMKNHPIFHVLYLSHIKNHLYQEKFQVPPLPIEIEG
jgi:hypothetical protein